MPAQVTADEHDGDHQQDNEAEVGQDESDRHEPEHQRQHNRDEASHQAEAAFWALTASILEAENDTPERSAMFQVVATRSVTLTGVNWPRPRTSPAL